MDKKNISVETVEDMSTMEIVEGTAKHVLDVVREHGGETPSLKAFAMALGIQVTRLNRTAKNPIPGQVYDPDIVNWDALNDLFYGQIASEKCAITSIDELVDKAMEIEESLRTMPTRRSSISSIMVDGVEMVARKAAMFEMGSENETLLAFKNDAGVYKMVYQTAGYTAIRPVGPDGEFNSELIRVVSNGTLNTKVVPPATLAEAIQDRFSGAYQERHLLDYNVVGMEHPKKVEDNNTEEAAAE